MPLGEHVLERVWKQQVEDRVRLHRIRRSPLGRHELVEAPRIGERACPLRRRELLEGAHEAEEEPHVRVPTRLRRPEARHATGVEGRVELVGDGGWIRQQLEDRDDVLAALPAAGVRLREQQDVDELGAHLDHVRTAAGQVVQQLADERALREVFVSDCVLERAGVVACPQRPIRREQRSVEMEAALSERANRRVNLLAAPFRLGHGSLPSCSLSD